MLCYNINDIQEIWIRNKKIKMEVDSMKVDNTKDLGIAEEKIYLEGELRKLLPKIKSGEIYLSLLKSSCTALKCVGLLTELTPDNLCLKIDDVTLYFDSIGDPLDKHPNTAKGYLFDRSFRRSSSFHD